MVLGYSETPYERIVGVGWATGFVGVLTLTYSDSEAFVIQSLGSPAAFPETLPSQPTLTHADYQAESILVMEDAETITTLLATLSFTRHFQVDLVAGSGPYGDAADQAAFLAEVAAAEAQQGRPADTILIEQNYTTDFDTITHPNGSEDTYQTGITPFFDFHWDTYLWTHTEDVPETFEIIYKRDWFINFGRNAGDSAGVETVQMQLGAEFLVPYTYIARLRVYGYRSSFTINAANGALTTEATVRYDATKAWPSTLGDHKLTFDESGFLGEIEPI